MQVRYRIRYKGYRSPIFAMPSGNVFVDIMVSKLNARGDHTWAVRDSRFERRVS